MARRKSVSCFLRAALRAGLAVGVAVVLLGPAASQDAPPPAPPVKQPAAPLTPAQLDRLTAPIALYPDPLVAQILVAATYPLEIVEADRWLRQPENAALNGEALAAALAPLRWDESVKALAAFPQILAMMDKYLSWTVELGDAFLAGQAAVMDSVQRLRRRAEAAGGLASTPEQVVSQDDGPIVIQPATPETVYVPVYDPNVAFGGWPYPDNSPYPFPDVFPVVATGGVGWVSVVVVEEPKPRLRCDWRRRRIAVDADGPGAGDAHRPSTVASTWQHDPAHRRGAAYRDPAVRARFQAAATAERSRAFRNLPPTAAAPFIRPAVGAAHPSSVAAGRPAAPQIVRTPALATATPPVVLRGSAPAAPALRRAPETPAAARLPAAARPPSVHRAMPSPVAAAPAVAAPTPAGTPRAPRVAPAPPPAPIPAPRAAPALDRMMDRR